MGRRRTTNRRIPIGERLMRKVIPEPMSGCWLWTGGVNEHGYGILGRGGRGEGFSKAHRVSWELHRGPIPDGLNVLHKCDNPYCVNPDHLYIGTMKQNSRDMVERNRLKLPDNRGERAAWAVLTETAVRHIRLREMTAIQYSKMYGCSRSAIYMIWCGKNWASVQ